MASFNVHEAKVKFSKLLDLVNEGEEVVITRNGLPVAELVAARKRPFPIGSGRHDPRLNLAALRSDGWWKPMTDQEVEDFIIGRY
jgi:prevent-host-death family protein